MRIAAMAIALSATAAAILLLKKYPIAIQVNKRLLDEECPMKQFRKACDEAKEHLEKYDETTPHKSPAIQKLIDMTDEEYNAFYDRVVNEQAKWREEHHVFNSTSDIPVQYSLRICRVKPPYILKI